VRDAMVQRVKEPDILAGMRNFRRDTLERPEGPGEIGSIIDDRDQPGGSFTVPDPLLFEEMHPFLRAVQSYLYRTCRPLASPSKSRSLRSVHRWRFGDGERARDVLVAPDGTPGIRGIVFDEHTLRQIPSEHALGVAAELATICNIEDAEGVRA